ncbi:MAG: glycogen synthase GlgA [bacterium]
MTTYNVLYLTSELYPFAKVGGLADVAGALPKALKELEHDVRVFMPKYKVIRDRKWNLREVIRLRDIEVPMAGKTHTVSVKSGFVPDSKVQAYFLEYKPFFDRKDIYIDPKTGEGWKDDAQRFALFARAALETLKVLFWQPDLIHCNDWPSALVPYYLKTVYKDDPFFEKTKTVLTIHNFAYQGSFPEDVAPQIGMDNFDAKHPANHQGRINFLKAGITYANQITTVSPSYAKQILKPHEWWGGLDTVLKKRKADLTGILNGIDGSVWNPETDKEIEATYSRSTLTDKAKNRDALCKELKLEKCGERMIVGMIGRLVDQKGLDLIIESIKDLLALPINLVVLGTGQKNIEEKLTKVAVRNSGQLALKLVHDDVLAHKIEAGADVLLMPSKYEPCGLNQLYSLKYGTPPIVYGTGGLADTVVEFSKDKGNGFRFDQYRAVSMVAAVKRALKVWKDDKSWKKLQMNGMKEDHDWIKSAKLLAKVYGKAVSV